MAKIKLKYVNGFSNRDRKSQRVRYYFRRRGMQSIPLPGIPGSEEFMAAYSMALAMIPDSAEIGASRTSPDSGSVAPMNTILPAHLLSSSVRSVPNVEDSLGA